MPTELGVVLGVWAHPDDEAYLSAGIMGATRRRRPGRRGHRHLRRARYARPAALAAGELTAIAGTSSTPAFR
jgi:hypothetical protein